jgi:hypothetical protein
MQSLNGSWNGFFVLNMVSPEALSPEAVETRTPAMQAGLASRRLTFREVFEGVPGPLLYVLIAIDFGTSDNRINRVLAAA